METYQGATVEHHIVAFRHHCHTSRILCFNIPDRCPICQEDLRTVRFNAPPVRFPSVFVMASVSPCSIVIKPTVGTFLNDYKDGADLHTGITNTKGAVFAFDETGMQVSKGRQTWKQCVAVAMLDQYDGDIHESWDETLRSEADMEEWRKEKYQEHSHNCFDFVVSFLNHLQYNQTKRNATSGTSREDLCQDYIVPLTVRASNTVKHMNLVLDKPSCFRFVPTMGT